MAFTRKFLSALGIEADKIDEIISAHTEVTDGLKNERDKYKADAEKVDEITKERDKYKSEAEKNGGNSEKYDKLKKEFDDYKAEIKEKETRTAKEKAYRDMLADVLDDKGITKAVKYAEWDKIELDNDGKLKDASEHIKSVQEEWSDYKLTKIREGSSTPPPAKSGGSIAVKTREEIEAIKDPTERRAEIAKAISTNPNFFNSKGE
jgi:hypothetical protein